ncbi:MAG: hypothetical protein ACRDHM_04130 [Actinomycetota bacterium]
MPIYKERWPKNAPRHVKVSLRGTLTQFALKEDPQEEQPAQMAAPPAAKPQRRRRG